MYVCTEVCIYVCTYVCMYVMCVFTYHDNYHNFFSGGNHTEVPEIQKSQHQQLNREDAFESHSTRWHECSFASSDSPFGRPSYAISRQADRKEGEPLSESSQDRSHAPSVTPLAPVLSQIGLQAHPEGERKKREPEG